jgi:DNA mismatch repair protein MutS2
LEIIEDTEPELKLLGLRVEEALDAIDKFLDRAYLSRLPEVRIIHGFGTGKLRRAIGGFLTEHQHVASHAVEGGVTVVQLKDE